MIASWYSPTGYYKTILWQSQNKTFITVYQLEYTCTPIAGHVYCNCETRVHLLMDDHRKGVLVFA